MAEQGTATEKTVADDELAQAWDQAESNEDVKQTTEEAKTETSEQTPPETASEEEPKDDSAKHKEDSRLGRKMKGLESRFDQLLARLEQNAAAAKSEPVEVPDVVSTAEDVEKVLQARETKSRQVKADYEAKYLKQVEQLKAATEDGELHEEIVAEMLSNPKFNVMHDQHNPFADARVNYSEAKAHILTQKYSGNAPKVPARETAGKPPVTPAASATRTAARTVALPKLDETAQQYVNYLRSKGMSEEDIAKELE